MTQLVGVLCEDRTKVILVSDRMVSTGDGSITFEHEPKFALIAPNAIVLTAGSVHEPEIIIDAKIAIGDAKKSIREIADIVAEKFRIARQKHVVQEILEPYGLTSFEDYIEKQQRLHEDTNLRIIRKIDEYEFELAYIIGGVDEFAHLYFISDPGTSQCWDTAGFCTAGSGDRHAEPVFAFYEYRPSMMASEALQVAYEAKKRAEMAGGVGKETDEWIITKEGCYEVDKETIIQIEAIRGTKDSFSRFRQKFEVKCKPLGCATP